MISTVDTEVIPDWATGYALNVPCIWEGCDREVEWFGNQHGCRKGHCCDFHLREYLQEINEDMGKRGYVGCLKCRGRFHDIHIYFKAVRI